MHKHISRRSRVTTLVRLAALIAILGGQSGLAQEIIVDNKSENAFPSANWRTSSGPNPYLGNSVYHNYNATFLWRAYLPAPGDYDVYAWWTYHSNRSNNVPYKIDAIGVGSQIPDVVYVDQHDPDLGGQWNLLGRFSFLERADIIVSSENGQASADAVRLVRVDGHSLGQLNEVVVEIPFHHLGDGSGFFDYVVPDTEGIYWETTVSLEKSDLEESSTAYLELFLFNNDRNNLLINGRRYALPYTEPVNGQMLPNIGKTIINFPHNLLREGANTIAFEANSFVSPSGLDDFEFGEVILVLGR